MAYAIIKWCGRVLSFILFVIQIVAFAFFQFQGQFNSGWLHSFWQVIALLLYYFIVYAFSAIFVFEATRNLSQLFFGWKLYIGCFFVPNVMGIFGGIANFEEDTHPSGINILTSTVCATPIMLLLLLITADDSFSSRNHKDLVRLPDGL